MPRNDESFILTDIDSVSDFVAKMSSDMYDYIKNKSDSKFIMFYKYITHSDLATFGKATQSNMLQNNLLYYINESEMRNIEKQTNRPFQTAHQSCIGLKKELYNLIGMPDPRTTTPYLINDYMNVMLVNSTVEYFNSSYTKLVFEKLNKQISGRKLLSWQFDSLNVDLSEGAFTPIDLHIAVHGIGMEQDAEFHKLRHHIFKGDTIILLCEKSSHGDNLFILLEKNPAFFSIIGVNNKAYENYQAQTRQRLINRVTNRYNAVGNENIENEITRQQQSAWRKMLAVEMMGYTQVTDEVFCPFTYISADFKSLGALFIASHIKGFSDSETKNEEKYDINNGLLLCANADALFDKHLITIGEDKELIFSFLIKNDIRLTQQLLLLQPIFKPVLNEKRMKYLEYHRKKFEEIEEERKRQ